MRKFFITFFFAAALVLIGIQLRQFNWDIIGYTATVYFEKGERGTDLRDKTYLEIQKITPEKVYSDLSFANAYRHEVRISPSALEEHIPFYSIRVAYIYAIKWTSAMFSIPYAQATYILSAFFAGLCVLILPSIVPIETFWLLFFYPLIIYVAGFLEIASLSSPDSMAAAIALFVFLTYEKSYILTLLLLTILPFVRTDYVILSALISVTAASRKRYLSALIYVLFPLLSFLTVNELNNNYGYLKIFNFTLIKINSHPATMTIEASIWPYIKAYGKGFSELLGHRHFLIFLAYFIMWFKHFRPKKMQQLNEQIFLVLGFVALHMLLFPAYYQRFFAWCAAIAGLQLVSWAHELEFHRKFINFFNRHEK